MRLQTQYEKIAKKEIRKYLDGQQERILESLPKEKAVDTQGLDLKEENGLLTETVSPIVWELAQESGELALLFAGADELEFELTKALRDAIHSSVGLMAGNYNSDTLEQLAESLNEGVAAGENLDKLKKRVEAVYEDARGYRAERVARYETLKGSNAATEAAYKQTGYVKAKRWYTNPGACEFCIVMNGKIVNLGGSFFEVGQNVTGEEGGEYAVTYDTVFFPPLHPNCRCTIVPVID